ncbi:MAG: TPR end-of-group domain-containing protein [Fimbriiglobus sp.]
MPKPRRRPAILGNVALLKLAEQPQIDFEMGFFGQILARLPDYVDALRVYADNLNEKGQNREALKLFRQAVALKPDDGRTHVDLAGQYATLAQPDLALQELQAALTRGYANWQHLHHDRKFDLIRNDPRFVALLKASKPTKS